MSTYMLAARNDMPSYIISNTIVSSSDSFEIIIASMLLFVIITAALCFPPAGYIFCTVCSLLSVCFCIHMVPVLRVGLVPLFLSSSSGCLLPFWSAADLFECI